MKKTLLLSLLFILSTVLAHGATCNVGYYLDSSGNCEKCVQPEPFYCPGDDMRHECPPALDDYSELANQTFGASEIIFADQVGSWPNGPAIDSMYDCFHDTWVRTPMGEVLLECNAGEAINYWCPQSSYLWYKANPGYYLSNYNWTSAYAWYRYVKPCENIPPENAHFADETEPDNSICAWECDDGYGQHENSCLPLCTMGKTKFHVGNGVSFNLYRDKITIPSINVMDEYGTVCHVCIAPGRGRLNLSDGVNIWHATD